MAAPYTLLPLLPQACYLHRPMRTLPDSSANGLRQLTELAEAAGARWVDDVLELPPALGTGSVQLLAPAPGLRLAIHRYRLRQAVHLVRQAETTSPETLLLSFHSFGPAAASHLATAQLASTSLAFTTTLPAHTDILLVAVALTQPLLTSWLADAPSPLAAWGSAGGPLVLDALLTPELQAVLRELSTPRPPHALDAFFYRIKAQELVYWLLRELGQRAHVPVRPLHAADVAKIYQVRERLLADLAAVPRLPQLGQAVGLSETRLKRLFRQVFGTSPFEYYQQARLAEARQQLAHASVAEVGYQLGFTNLSHFARLFRRYYGLTPKKYQASLAEGTV